MLTENSHATHYTLSALFYRLKTGLKGKKLKKALDRAWDIDPNATLKIIWNARSIHLGDASRETFYRAIGWLYETHPATLLVNLPWLVQPPPSKKRKIEKDESDSELDVKNGLSHGYWKDPLNILALAVRGELRVGGKFALVTNPGAGDRLIYIHIDGKRRKRSQNGSKPATRDWTPGRYQHTREAYHDTALAKLNTSSKYKALHLTIARLFVDQLKLDLDHLHSDRKAAISLCAKWAPSNKGSNDKQTCIVTSIAETLYPFSSVCPDSVDPAADRTLYLKHARNSYQTSTLSKLRAHLQIVERDISAQTFEKIVYANVPELAMKRYEEVFRRKDLERFDGYRDYEARRKWEKSGEVGFGKERKHDSVARVMGHEGYRMLKVVD
ncbi:uncharacterized protein MYCFIDRAFT_145840 [Pseudocercospora fijiensis CIRAD86]|uniref:DUF2828 domain-containing protein n=1 Tax=Pseudocercospora fijiensis (strain CIRAD86) TaxID=383855 RepID=M2ZG85_PSEFD|nr:uncharacterized protein MYCFIDRAFT_145840 [Pseudocercospora fijiensis CIRAD86]EME78149.1 hypothetical protein MYCFIDRAFT_145840 [Pseudocercospora fijiensis CIRAD86]